MNEVLHILILLEEILLMLQCMQIVFRQNMRFDKYMAMVIMTDLVVYTAIAMQLIPRIFTFLVYIVLFVYCRRVFKQSMKITVVRFIITFALTCCIQAVTALVIAFFTGTITDMFLTFVIGLVGLLFAYVIKKIVYFVEKKEISFGNSGIFAIVIICGVVTGVVIINYYFNSGVINLNVVLTLLLVLLMFFCLYRLEQVNGEIQRKNYELEVQRVYGGTYEELLREVRRKQHDYKNQIGAIYSMHLVANSLEELADMQKEYMDDLQSGSRYDSILTRCNNAILAGYLYHRCMSCEQENVEVDYDIQVGQAESDFAIHEIIEILGILIDNACENFAAEQQSGKHVKLEFKETEEAIMFAVANPARHMSFAEISNMFTRGYSSKGENRGIGLARVQELVNQRGAELKVANVDYNDTNWLKFTINIEKRNG